MLYPASAGAPEIDVRKIVCTVEDVWHDNGPRLARPLRRGSLAAVLRNPYAGRIIGAVLSLQGRWRIVGAIGGESGRTVGVAAPATHLPRVRDDRIAAV